MSTIVTVNGITGDTAVVQFSNGTNVAGVVRTIKFEGDVTISLNGNVVEKPDLESTEVHDGDVVAVTAEVSNG